MHENDVESALDFIKSAPFSGKKLSIFSICVENKLIDKNIQEYALTSGKKITVYALQTIKSQESDENGAQASKKDKIRQTLSSVT